jgi:hypothetical protein
VTTPDIAGLCERLRRPGLKSAAEAAAALERQAAEIAALRDELVEARTLDKGFYEWMIERDLLARGEEVEWGDIVVALTEHEIELTKADERQAAEIERLRGALGPFAKAAALFDTGDYVNHDACIYRPAAGDEYSLSSGHLLAARAALTGEDTATLSLSGKTQTDDRTRGDG